MTSSKVQTSAKVKGKARVKATTETTTPTPETTTPTTTPDKVVLKATTTPKIKASLYLADGVTGKALQASKIATNFDIKAEIYSLSYCIKLVLKHDNGFLTKLRLTEKELTPANLLKYKKEKEAKNGKFSAWLIMTLCNRYAKDRATQK